MVLLLWQYMDMANNKVQSMIDAALASGSTPTERLENFLKLTPPKGFPGAAKLRERQDRVKARLEPILPWQATEPQPYVSACYYREFAGVRIAWKYNDPQSARMTPDSWRDAVHIRKSAGLRKAAERLAAEAGQLWDEHGSSRGDYLSTRGLDFVPPHVAKAAPYCDMGGRGLAVIGITRHRVYAKSSKWYPRDTQSNFLIGRNEAGTWFAHAIPNAIGTVRGAVDWIWSGKADKIIARQGDIALIESRGPARIAPLPSGHRVNGTTIYHETHPPIPKPEYGQAVIVARRAVVRASNETRD